MSVDFLSANLGDEHFLSFSIIFYYPARPNTSQMHSFQFFLVNQNILFVVSLAYGAISGQQAELAVFSSSHHVFFFSCSFGA